MFRLLEPIPDDTGSCRNNHHRGPDYPSSGDTHDDNGSGGIAAPTRSPVSVFTVTGSMALLAVAWGEYREGNNFFSATGRE
jgi:hypothetical protein